MHLLCFAQFLLIGLSAGLFILSTNLLYWVLVAVVLMCRVILILLGFKISFRVLHVLFFGILFFSFLIVFFLTRLAFFILILVHKLLVFLYHALQVLKNHFSCEETSDQGLHFDD